MRIGSKKRTFIGVGRAILIAAAAEAKPSGIVQDNYYSGQLGGGTRQIAHGLNISLKRLVVSLTTVSKQPGASFAQ